MSAPEVRADVKIIPAKRSASYDVPIESDRERPRLLLAKVNSSDITLSSNWPTADGRGGLVKMPKTLEAAAALAALAEAIKAELIEQGVTD